MADKGIVARAKVEALVESIRAKTGITGPLSFDTMITAVDGIQTGGGSANVVDPVAYYKAHRNKDYPYFPLPSEMTETEDTIYMLYGAKGYMCCPVFRVTFTSCVCTVYKYNNTTLVSSYVEPLTSGSTKYMQFSEEDEDYSTYNYIVIKLQGTIKAHYLNYASKFNGVAYNNNNSSSELIEVSGKCASCDVKVINSSNNKYHQNLEYYSFFGVNTISMRNMFSNCNSLQTIPELDTSQVTNMSNMFYNCLSLQMIPQLDTSQVTDMSYMFHNCFPLQAIPQLNTSQVTNMSSMFRSCSSLQMIPELDTSQVTNMNYMFYYCYSLQMIPELDTSQVTDMSNMFSSCNFLQTIPELNTSKVTNMKNMFQNCNSLQTIPELDTSQVTNMSNMFYNCLSLQMIPELDTSQVTDMSNMFSSCSSLQMIPELDTSQVTNMNYMFSSCYSLQAIPELNTSQVANISGIFNSCYILVKTKLTNIKLGLQVGSGTSYGHMLTLDSLIGLCKECINTGSALTLTIGSANLEKIQNSGKYYKFVDSTVTEIAVNEKGEIEECDSTATGSFSITDYMAMKNWTLA